MKYLPLLIIVLLSGCQNEPEKLSKDDSIKQDSFIAKRMREVTDTTIQNGTPQTPLQFITFVKQNQAVIDADITDVNFLYISVINDGISKDGMATYYCRMAVKYNIDIAAVKVVDAATAKLYHNGTASGTELGKHFCN